MLSKVIKFVSDIFESEESKKQKREEERNLKANLAYRVFKEKLNKKLPFLKVSESKNIRKEERQLTYSMPNEHIENLSKQGIETNSMLDDLLVNQLISYIQKEYIEKMFAIGWESHFKIRNETGKIFNISLDPLDVNKKKKKKTKNTVEKLGDKWKKLSEDVANFNKPPQKYPESEKEEIEIYPVVSHKGYSKRILESYSDGMLSIERKRFEGDDELNYENLSTIQIKLLNNISLAIKELEHKNLPTRERKYRLFTNMHIATALQDAADFNVNNTILSQQTGQPFKLCSVLNETVEIWVDPIMSAKDNRICISYMDSKILMAAEEKIWINTLPSKDGNKKLMSLTYGIEYLGDFSDCITLDVYMGDMNIT
jgi:hypothetical protein